VDRIELVDDGPQCLVFLYINGFPHEKHAQAHVEEDLPDEVFVRQPLFFQVYMTYLISMTLD